MKNLTGILQKATQEHWATGHFNISNLEQFRAIMETARELKTPIMIGASEGERAFFGMKKAVSLVALAWEEYGVPVFLNSDHSKSIESAKEAFDNGFTSIHIDLSKLPYEENLAGTKEVVDYVKSKNPDVSVEGELGYLVTDSSKVYKEVVEIPPESLTNPEQAAEYVAKTGVDRFSGAYGNLHGIAANEPKLDIERIEAIRKILPENVAMVLHGGSGISDADMKKAIEAGIANIHINTEIRMAFAEALRKSLADNPEEITPYKLTLPTIDAVKAVVRARLELFENVNRL